MPTMRGSSVKVIGTSALDFRDYHKMKNPNAVIFNPGRNKPQTPLPPSSAKIQGGDGPLHLLNIKRCEDQQKPRRPQSALIISCSGPRHVEFEVEKPRPRSAAPPQRARPQSAITYREKRPKSPKRRPQSATTYKSSTVSSGEPPDVADLIEDIREMVFQKRRFTKRVWKPKKPENGIQHPPPPPPPNRHYLPEDPPKENEGTPKHNGLAKFRKFKYPQNFHSYGRNNKNILRQSMVNSREIPECLKHPHQYHFAASRQSCRYKPWASVTSVSHHHKVGSAALPHPPRLVETPPPGSPRTALQTNLHMELADALEAVERDYDEEDEEEDDLDGSRNNNGSYYYKHEEDTSKNLTYTESDGDMTDRYRTSDTDRSTSARTPRRENNDDLYFLTANMPTSDTNKNSGNNNKSADIMNTTVIMSDIEEVGEPVYKTPGSDKSDLADEVEEILSEDRTPPRRSSTSKNAQEIEDELPDSVDDLKWNMSGTTGKAEKEEKEAGLGWSNSSSGRAARAAEGSLLRWDSKGDVQTPSRKSSIGARSDTKTPSRKNSTGGGSDAKMHSRQNSVGGLSDVKTHSRQNSVGGGSDVKTQSRKNSIGSGSDAKIPSRKGSTSSEVKAIIEDTKSGADSDLDDMYDFDPLSDDDDDDAGSIGSDILDELDKLEQRKEHLK